MSPLSHAHGLDPFSVTANPAAYVPTPAVERALGQMLAALDAGWIPVLSGPPGLGKTLLLQLVAERVRDRFEPYYMPYAKLAPRDFAALALDMLERDAGPDPPARLLAVARERAGLGRPLLLLVDDAAALPRETAEAIADWLREAQGALRLALAGLPGESLRAATRPIETLAEQVHLNEGLPPEQLPAYVAARLESADAAPALRAAFDATALEALARVSEGNPRKLHLAAQAIVRDALGDDPAAASARAAARREPAAAHGAAPTAPTATVPPLPPPSFDLGEYRFVRGRFVDPRTGEVLAKPEEEIPHAEALHPPARTVARPDPERPSAPAPDFSIEDALESFESDDEADWMREAAVGLDAPPVPPRERPAARPAAPAPPRRRRRWPGWLAAAVAGTAFGIGLATQIEHLEPLLQDAVRDGLARLEPGATPERVEPAPRPPETDETDLLRWAPPPLPEAQLTAPPEVAAETEAGAATELAPPPAGRPSAATGAVVVAPDAVVPTPDAEPPVETIAVAINANPWAVIEVDGREVGETPLAGLELPIGRHRFVARMPDGTRRERVLRVDAENDTVVFE